VVLLLQVVAVLVAGAVLATVAAAGITRGRLVTSLTVLAIALGYLAFGSRVWAVGKLFATQHKAWAAFDPGQASLAAEPPSVDRGFPDWIHQRLHKGDTFLIVPPASGDPSILQWLTYRLLPNLAVEHVNRADVLIFYGTTPRKSGYSRYVAGVAEQYGPNLSIARTRNAP
jgi:hypothetical protein